MSEMYSDESFIPESATLLDFRDEPGTSCYCDPEASAHIRNVIAKLPSDSLRWIDGGDYHYLSYFWMLKLSEPFVLVLFDNHPDNQEGAFGDDLLSCGGWVRDARRDCEALRDVFWIRGSHDLGKSDAALATGLPIYLSVDKDVLDEFEYRTDWDQGSMTSNELKGAISHLLSSGRIIGIDVCGGLTRAKGASEQDLEINRNFDYELMNLLLTFTR